MLVFMVLRGNRGSKGLPRIVIDWNQLYRACRPSDFISDYFLTALYRDVCIKRLQNFLSFPSLPRLCQFARVILFHKHRSRLFSLTTFRSIPSSARETMAWLIVSTTTTTLCDYFVAFVSHSCLFYTTMSKPFLMRGVYFLSLIPGVVLR